tara:strand:+ start:677 stop:1087 length:411 start_codon:yes stop_codon:yes gene_type:complete
VLNMVDIYYNLHKKVFSIRYKGKVIDHAKTITVLHPRFVVQPAGRAKVLRDKVKNVHAFVRTDSLWTTENVEVLSRFTPQNDLSSYIPKHSETIKYNPYLSDSFIVCSTGDAVHKADIAYLTIDKQNKPCINICTN